jgi:hypothetical protein
MHKFVIVDFMGFCANFVFAHLKNKFHSMFRAWIHVAFIGKSYFDFLRWPLTNIVGNKA